MVDYYHIYCDYELKAKENRMLEALLFVDQFL